MYNVMCDFLHLYESVEVQRFSFESYIESYADGMGEYLGRP